MERIGEAQLGRHLLDEDIGVLQPLCREVHLQTHQVLIGGLMVVAAEEPAEVGRVDVALASNLGQAGQPREVGLDVLPAAFIRGVGGSLGGFPVRQRFADLQHQIFQQRRAR